MANMSMTKNPIPEQEPLVRNKNFDEVALGYTEEIAIDEAKRCLNCRQHPCVSGCPVNVRIPEFIAKVAEGEFEEAYKIITSTNSLPAVCGRVCPQEHQCEGKCVRGIKGESVGIGRLERFVADWHAAHADPNAKVEKPVSNGHRVAVVGSGPAGLTCAGDLARMGYEVTVYELFHKAGGVLVYGIPEFRLPKAIVAREVAALEEMGVKIVTDAVIGRAISIDELLTEEGFEAVFLGSGAGLPRFLGIPGENLLGVYSANEFLTRINLMKAYREDYDTPIKHHKCVAVVGAGNVAMDAARCAKRLGAEHVYVVYRRGMEEVPARKEEVHHAQEEEVEFKLLTNPVRVIGDEKGEERNRLRELIRGLEPGEGLGAIVRTVSAGTSKTTLQKDLSFLKRVWKDIRKRATTEKVPSLIYQEPGLASRSVRDYLSDDVSEVWVDNAETAEAIREMASLLFPRKGDLVHLYEKHDKTLWEHFGLLNQIEQVHSREVLMPSGGRLVFDQTEALMAIDINSGKIGGKTNFEAMAFRTNMEAATAIARQLRLRDIGGQIVIDFIEMRDPEHCREVEKELRNAMKGDRARHDIGKMSSFGLLQIVRQRTGSSAISISMETCPHCKGTGQRRNMEWQSVQTLRDLHRAMRSAAAAGQTEYAHSVDAELGLYLLNHKRERLSLMEKEFHIRLDIRIEGISSAPAAPAQQQGHQHNGQNNGR